MTTWIDGETSPLLSGTPTPTLRDSDEDSYYGARDSRASFSWLIPVAVLATLSNTLTAFSRQMFFRQFVCEEIAIPDLSLLRISGDMLLQSSSKLDCTDPPYLYGILSLNTVSMVVTCISCSLTTGWWSRQGDMHGRRYPLMVSVLGSTLLNLVFALVADSPVFEGFAKPCAFLGLLLEGLLGGTATFRAAVHAYTADTSPAGSWSTSFSVIQGLFMLCTILGNWIGTGMGFFAPFLPFGVSVALGVINLGFILFFLPESLPQDFTFDRPSKLSFEDVKKTIYSTISIFAASYQMAFLGLALFLYSLTSSADSSRLLFVSRRDLHSPTSFSPGFFIALSSLVRMGAFFIVVPAILYFLKKRSPLSLAISTKHYFLSVINIDASAARYSVLADFMFQLFILGVPTSPSAIFFSLALVAPLTVGTRPALYSLIAVSSEVRGGVPRRGAAFGAISVIVLVGEMLSHILYVSTIKVWGSFLKVGFALTAALLGAVALFLWPAERLSHDTPDHERIRIVVSDDARSPGHDPATISPVYRRHGVTGSSGDTH